MRGLSLVAMLRLLASSMGVGLGIYALYRVTGIWRAPQFAHPSALLLLPLAVFLPMQRALTGVNRLALPGASAGRRSFSWRVSLAWVPDASLAVGMGCLILALAGPREVNNEVVIDADGLDILLAIDTSCSMEAADMRGGLGEISRLAAAKGVLAEFVQARPHDRIGLVVFGEEAFTQVPLTMDHETLVASLDLIQLGIAGARGTAIGQAIAVGARRLQQVEAEERLLILLTDGQSNAGAIEPLEAADLAKATGVRIYTIGVGGQGGRGLFGSFMGGGGLDEGTLRRIAMRTGGQYFRAGTQSDLREVYATIDELETTPAEVTEISDPIPWFRWILAPGLLLLLVHLLLSATVLRRGP